jgi:Tol biopolymer transport system component
LRDPENPIFDGYLHVMDLETRTTKVLPLSKQGTDREGDFFIPYYSYYDVTRDGSHVLFLADDPLVGGVSWPSTVENAVLYRYDVENEIMELVSIDETGEPWLRCRAGAFLGGKDRIVYETWDSRLFIRDMQAGTTTYLTTGELLWNTRTVSADGNTLLFLDERGRFPDESESVNQSDDQLYAMNLTTMEIQRVTSRVDGSPTDSNPLNNSISLDGKYVVFTTFDEQMAVEQPRSSKAVYFHDLTTGQTELVADVEGIALFGGIDNPPDVSSGGRYVAFQSRRNDLSATPGPEGIANAYLKDRQTGTFLNLTALVDSPRTDLVDFSDSQAGFCFSADGRYLAFNTRRSGGRGYRVTYLYDIATGSLREISDELGLYNASEVKQFVTSFTGNETAFLTDELLAPDPGDEVPYVFRVYLTDLIANTLESLSIDYEGIPRVAESGEHNLTRGSMDISEDGQTVAFSSKLRLGSEWEPREGWQDEDVFLYLRGEGKTHQLSSEGDDDTVSLHCSVSGDGRWTVFTTAKGFVPITHPERMRVFLVDNEDFEPVGAFDEAKRVLLWNSVRSYEAIMLNRTGEHMVLISRPLDESTSFGDRTDIELYTRGEASPTLLTSGFNQRSGRDNRVDISADGRFVIFSSDASDIVENDTNEKTDVFLYDRDNESFRRISVNSRGEQIASASRFGSIDEAGRYVTFVSNATDLVADDDNGTYDVFVKDLVTGEVALASTTSDGRTPDGASDQAELTGDGKKIAFRSYASDIVKATNQFSIDAFLAPNPLHQR